ncbi:MAG TPA: hypothetical protein VM099_07790 [Gemmatimonadaceae bacterium]|nr:hypothetical protein [Gemmatimonadaceae bacterium]
MANSNRIAQAYGYAVCFIAVVTILISTSAIVKSLFDISDPLRAEGYGRPLTSFSSYKREQQYQRTGPSRVRPTSTVPDSAARPPSETELRQMFEDERLDQIGSVRFRSMKTLVSSVLLMVVAFLLFFIHWRWLRREDQKV